MKKILCGLSAIALSTAIFAGAAQAQQFTPNGKWAVAGNVQLYQSIPGVNCNISGTLEVVSGVAKITGVTLSPGSTPLCGTAIVPITTDWPVEALNATTKTLRVNVDVNAYAGRCAGWLSNAAPNVTLSVSPNKFVFAGPIGSGSKVNGYLYSNPSVPVPCYVTGELTITPIAPTTGAVNIL